MSQSKILLKKYATSKSKFFNLPDGAEAKVKFLFAEIVPNYFDKGETECIRYHLEVEGTELLWDRTSRQLANDMAQVSEGEVILIRRAGQKNKTKYYIERTGE